MNQPQLRGRLVQDVVEVILREIEREQEAAQQAPPKLSHCLVVRVHALSKQSDFSGPTVGSEQPIPRQVVWISLGQVERQIEGLFAVLRPGVEDLLARRHVAAMVARAADVVALLDALWQREEVSCGGLEAALQRVRQTVLLRVEKAGIARGAVQR